MKSFIRIHLLAAAALTFFAAQAQAQTATSPIAVSATVIANCTISTTGQIAFGNYDPVVANAAAHLDTTGTIEVACTGGSTISIGLDEGTAGNGTPLVPVRRMNDGTAGPNYLTYELFSDAGRTVTWGDIGSTIEVVPTPHANITPVPYTIYARVPQGQTTAIDGTYGDTVTATVSF